MVVRSWRTVSGSPSMRLALDLAAESGTLQRYRGGFWAPPGEPTCEKCGALEYAEPSEKWERSVGSVTVYALERRGLLALSITYNEGGYPEEGSARLLVSGSW